MNNTRTPAAGGATVSESVNFVTDPDLDPKYNVTQYWGIETWDGYSSSYSSTRSFKLTNAAPPAATAMSPDMSWVTTNQPTLTVDAVTDSDGDPVTYKFRVCSQQVWTSDTSKCVESGFQTTRSWTVPSNSPLVWSTTNYWWVVTSDGAAQTESGTQASIVPQRTPASHPQLGFGVQPNMRPVAGVNTATGNLTYTADDLEVASSSQPLVFQRIYNSASDRPGGFGVGWTHSWDYRLETDTQGATVYGPDGDGMFFGQNPDGTYAMEFANGSELAQNPTGVPAPISAVGAAGWQLTTSDKTRIYFTPAGAFLGLVDSVGRTVTRTTSGNTQTITDVESGRTLHLEWDATPDAVGSRIIAVRTAPVTPAGGGTAVPIEWHYFYDAAGQLDQACDPRDNRKDLGTCYSFDWIGGLLQRVVLPKGNTQIALTYDAQDRVGTRSDGEGNTWTYEYGTDVTFQTLPDPNNNNQVYTVVAPYQTTVTNPRSFQDEFFYDTAMRLIYVDRLDDSAEHIEYDFNSWATKMSFDDTTTTAPSGTSTYAFENEPDGDVTVLVEPTGETTTASYSAITNALESITAPGGIQTTVTVNTAGQPQTIATPGEGSITVDYTTGTEPVVGQPGVVQPPGLPKEHTGLDGVTSQMSYNEFGDLVQVTTSTGLTTTFTHDEIGRVITETSTWNGQSAVRTVTYDELGQTTTVTDPRVQNMVSGQWHQARTTWVYDDNTNPESISIADIEPAANGFVPDPARQVSAEYDDNDRAWRLVDPEGNVSSVEFDHGENITRLVDVNGNVTVTAYDSEDRPITVTMLDVVDPTDPNAPARDVVLATMTYDQFSRLRTRTDALGRTVQYDYDPAGRLWKSTLLDFDRRDGAIVDVVLEEFGHDPTTGLLMWSEQANGQTRVDYGYDTSHRLATTTLRNTVSGFVSRDRTTTYGYDGGSMRIASQIISDGNGSSYETRWAYDSEGRLVSETVEDGPSDSTTSYIYGDSRSLVTGVTDPEQHTTTTDYDVLGRPWKRTNPAETVVAYGAAAQVEATFGITGYNTFGEPTHYQDADGNITETSYDGNGRPTVMTFPEYTPAGSSTPIAPTTVNEYDPAGNIERQTDRRGVVTDLEYDAFNRLTTMLAPPAVAGGPRAESLYRYDDVGNLTWARNAIGAELSKTYDDLNRVRSATQHVRRDAAPTDLLTSTYDYDWAGNQILAIDAAGTTVATAVFSPAGDRLAVTDALGYTTSTEYNALGQPLEQVDPAGNATVHTYRANGWLQSRQRFDATGAAVAGTLATFTYDLNGNLTSALRPDGRGPSYEYDDLNRLTRVTEPVDALTSNVTEYGYDARGLLSLVVDGRQNEWWTTYTPWATVESRIEPATSAHPNLADRTFTNIYEPGGNIARVDQPGGVSITRTFDQLGQVVAETGGSAGGDRGYGYDLLGRVTTVTSGATSVTVGYDDRNLLTAVTGTSGDSTFAYDAAGRMERRTDAAGVHLYDWTVRGELDHVADPLTGSTRDYTWSPDGTLDRYTVTTGTSVVTRDFAWDAAQRIVADVLTDDQSQVTRSVSYGYDANGNLDQRITAPAGLAGAGQDLYSYDWSNRLTAWTAPNATVTDYAYDPAGNLVGNGSVVNVYDERNRLLTSGGTSNSWTARGTLASSTDASGTTTYSHDGLGRLTAAGSIGYTFDGFDRIASRDGTPFVYSGLSSQPTSDGSSVVSRDPSGAIVSYSQGGQAVGVVTDRHRDVVATFDATGAIVDSLAFDPWGATLATVGVNDVRWGFQSSYTDPVSNLVSMGARWYDTAGSFVSRDTWSGRAQAPVTLNRYAYANNDPIGFYDPTGRCGLMVNVDGLGCGFSFKDRTYFTPTKYHSPTSSHITSRAKAARPAPPPPPAQPKLPKSFYAANDVLPKPPTPLAPTFNRSFLAANEVLPKVNASTVDDAGHRSNALMAQPRPVGEDRTSSGPTVPARLRDSSACSLPLSLLCANTVPRFPGDGSGLDIVDGKLNGIYQFVIIGSFERSDLHLAEQWKMLVDIGGFSFSGGDATRYTTFEEGTIYLVYNRRTAATETEPSILAAWSGSIDVWDEGTFSTLTWSKSGPDPTSGYGLPIATETDIANRFVRLNDGAGTLIPETIPFDTSGLPFGDAGRIPGLVVGRLR